MMNKYVDRDTIEDAIEDEQRSIHYTVRWIRTGVRIVLCIIVFVAFLLIFT